MPNPRNNNDSRAGRNTRPPYHLSGIGKMSIFVAIVVFVSVITGILYPRERRVVHQAPVTAVTVKALLEFFNKTYTEELANPRSSLYKDTEKELCEMVVALIKSSSRSEEFVSCGVLGFEQGSIKVTFKLTYALRSRSSNLAPDVQTVWDDLARAAMKKSQIPKDRFNTYKLNKAVLLEATADTAKVPVFTDNAMCSITDPDPCLSAPCGQNGKCQALQGYKYVCECKIGFGGDNCELVPVPADWSAWLEWESCSVSCGPGYTTRSHICDNPAPTNGGDYCTGHSLQVKECNLGICASVDGEWGSWAEWTNCAQSTSCGTNRARWLLCDSPAPAYGGAQCTGNTNTFEFPECTCIAACPAVDPCGSDKPAILTGTTGTVFSPGFTCGKDYSKNSVCAWKVEVTAGKRVHLTFLSFKVEWCGNNCDCCCDWVILYDGPSNASTSIGKYCGGSIIGSMPPDFTSTSNTVYITLDADTGGQNRGFSVRFSEI